MYICIHTYKYTYKYTYIYIFLISENHEHYNLNTTATLLSQSWTLPSTDHDPNTTLYRVAKAPHRFDFIFAHTQGLFPT